MSRLAADSGRSSIWRESARRVRRSLLRPPPSVSSVPEAPCWSRQTVTSRTTRASLVGVAIASGCGSRVRGSHDRACTLLRADAGKSGTDACAAPPAEPSRFRRGVSGRSRVSLHGTSRPCSRRQSPRMASITLWGETSLAISFGTQRMMTAVRPLVAMTRTLLNGDSGIPLARRVIIRLGCSDNDDVDVDVFECALTAVPGSSHRQLPCLFDHQCRERCRAAAEAFRKEHANRLQRCLDHSIPYG